MVARHSVRSSIAFDQFLILLRSSFSSGVPPGGFVPITGISDEEFIGGTEIQQTLPVFVDLTPTMRAKDCTYDRC